MAAVFLVRVSLSTLTMALLGVTATPALAQSTPTTDVPPVVAFNPDAGVVVQSGDFRITAWGFVERLIDPDGKDGWRRVRHGAEFDLPRLTPRLRAAVVYEVDLTNSDFLRNGPFRRNFENLFVSLQDADDPGRFRVLFGHNTHILSRDDNLSSGNLPTINRSLVLEEHGSVNAFGAQMGRDARQIELGTLPHPPPAILAVRVNQPFRKTPSGDAEIARLDDNASVRVER